MVLPPQQPAGELDPVVDAADAKGGKALRLDNRIGNKPNHFAICIVELQLVPGAEYELTARVKNVPEGANGTIGVCADKWGNKSQSYAKLPPAPGWQEIRKSFRAPVNGNLNLIIRNTGRIRRNADRFDQGRTEEVARFPEKRRAAESLIPAAPAPLLFPRPACRCRGNICGGMCF